MFIARANQQRCESRAFTLLEIAMAVAILGMMAIAIYRFVAVNLVALRVSTEQSVEDARYRGFLDYLTYQLQNLPPPTTTAIKVAGLTGTSRPSPPPRGSSPATPQPNPLATGDSPIAFAPTRAVLSGEPFKFNDRSRDEINWQASAGPGVLTRYADGDWTVSLRLRPVAKGGDRMEIGIARVPLGTTNPTAENESWVSLLQDVQSLEIRYFDPRLNSWIDKWTDTTVLPRLVRLTIGRGENVPLWEATIALGRTPL